LSAACRSVVCGLWVPRWEKARRSLSESLERAYGADKAVGASAMNMARWEWNNGSSGGHGEGDFTRM